MVHVYGSACILSFKWQIQGCTAMLFNEEPYTPHHMPHGSPMPEDDAIACHWGLSKHGPERLVISLADSLVIMYIQSYIKLDII